MDQGVIASALLQRRASGHGDSSRLPPVHKHMAATLAFGAAAEAPSTQDPAHRVITEGSGCRDHRHLGKATGDLKGYQQAIKDVSALDPLPTPRATRRASVPPPHHPARHPARQVLRAMVQRFDREASTVNGLDGGQGPDQQGDAITVASLIRRGRARRTCRGSRVIYERLNDKMKLQLDTTVLYAAPRAADVTVAQTQDTKSPYTPTCTLGCPLGRSTAPATPRSAPRCTRQKRVTGCTTVNPKTGLTVHQRFGVRDLRDRAEQLQRDPPLNALSSSG